MNGDGEWTYRCSHCETFKVEEEFHNDRSKPPFYLAYNCKVCRKNAKTHPKYASWVFENTYNYFDKIGYDIEKDISEQFKERVKLKYGITID